MVDDVVVTRVKPIVRMRVGSGHTVELSAGGLFLLRFYILVFSLLGAHCTCYGRFIFHHIKKSNFLDSEQRILRQF